MGLMQKLYFVLFFVCVNTKTIRSRIYTNENGTKELIFANNSRVKQEENATAEERPNEEGEEIITNENILMQHWNSLTEVGWKNFSHPTKKLFLNSTRVLRLAPEFKSEEENEVETSVETTEAPRSDEDSPTFDPCQSIIDMCQALQPQTDREHLLGCLTSKNKTEEESFDEDENVTCSEEGQGSGESPRTFLRPRRFLHKVLLPLLVVIVIKYLVTLPFVAVSVFTLNAMWLGLLSLGAVLFAKLKNHDHSPKYPHRRLGPIPANEYVEYGPPVTGSEIYWSPVRIPVAQSRLTPH